MIAEDFVRGLATFGGMEVSEAKLSSARVRVLATESITTPMVEGARTRTRVKDRRGRGQRGL